MRWSIYLEVLFLENFLLQLSSIITSMPITGYMLIGKNACSLCRFPTDSCMIFDVWNRNKISPYRDILTMNNSTENPLGFHFPCQLHVSKSHRKSCNIVTLKHLVHQVPIKQYDRIWNQYFIKFIWIDINHFKLLNAFHTLTYVKYLHTVAKPGKTCQIERERVGIKWYCCVWHKSVFWLDTRRI